MIIREWRGRATSEKAQDYTKHFHEKVVPELRHIKGFLSASLSQRKTKNGIEFLVLTCWESMEAVHAFAGADADRAVVEPGAVAALKDFDDTVNHYEIIEQVSSARNSLT